MFASQLLRILEAVPEDVKCERASSIEQAKRVKNMKENQDALDDPESFNRVEGCQEDNSPSDFKVIGADESWKLNFVDDIPADDGLAADDSVKNEDPNEPLHDPNSLEPHTDLPSVGANAEETVHDSLEQECMIPMEDAKLDESTFRDSTSTQIAASDLFDAETHVFTDKNELEFELKELVVFCKEVKHMVNDINIDEATPPLKETSDAAIHQTANADSEEDSFVDKRLPIEVFGTRSFLRSFLDSTHGEGIKAAQPPDEQWLPGKASSRGRQATMLRYDSKVEKGSITFDFCTKDRTETTDDNECVGSEETTLDHKEKDSHTDRSNNDANKENLCQDDIHWISSEYSHVERDKSDVGETSFSAANLAPCPSGSIAFSGSISLRSDGSTTSTRSFAFPVLQGEWSSSPVRMARAADGRHFRKQKCWRSGLLCCRF